VSASVAAAQHRRTEEAFAGLWLIVDQSVIDDAIDEWCKRL